MALSPKTQQVNIPNRSTFDPSVKQLSVPATSAVRARSKSPPAATAAAATPASKGLSAASKPVRQSSPANPFGDDGDDVEASANPFGDPDGDDYDDTLNPFS